MSNSWRLALAAVLLVGLLTRLALIVASHGSPLDDPDRYLEIARSLAGGQGFQIDGRPTAYRPPLYPLLLAPAAKLAPTERGFQTAVLGLNVALGLGAIGLTIATARRWGLGPSPSLLAGLIVALDPVLLSQSRLAMTETLASLLVAASLCTLARPSSRRSTPLLAGLALGLAALARPSLLAPAGLTLAAGLIRPGPHGRRHQALLAGLTILAVMAPWALRNRIVLGHTVWTTTHGGYTLALGNNPAYFDEVLHARSDRVFSGSPQHAWWDELGRLSAAARGDEVRADQIVRNHAIEVIRSRPRDFALASLDRLGRFWGIAPSGAVYPWPVRLATALWTVPLWGLLVIGLLQRHLYDWPRVAAPSFLLGLTFVHAIYWTDLRMRAPVVPAIALVAAYGWNQLRSRSKNRGQV